MLDGTLPFSGVASLRSVISPAQIALADAFRSEVVSLTSQGRALGRALDVDPARGKELMADFPLARALNTMGAPLAFCPVPFAKAGNDMLRGAAAVERAIVFETLAEVDLSLIFAAPGPAMSGILIPHLASDDQQYRYFSRFSKGLTWSSFALTERANGTDAFAMRTEAHAVPGGYRLYGEKYLIGGGAHADVVVVFARLKDEARAFVVDASEIGQERLALCGLRGANLGALRLDGAFCPEDNLLGAHLPRLRRAAVSAGTTLELLRPAIGLAALGAARGAIARACEMERISACRARDLLAPLEAARVMIFAAAQAADAQTLRPGQSGLAKTAGVTQASAAFRALFDVAALAPVAAPWFWRSWRNLRALEYTEGVAALHLQSAALLFQQEAVRQ